MIDAKEVLDLVNKSGVVIVIWSIESDESALYISDNISQFGYSPEDFYSGEFTDYWKFIHEDDRLRAKSDIYEARKNKLEHGENTCSITYRVRCRSGEVRYVEETLIYEIVDGKLSEKGFLRDITASTDLVQSLCITAEKYNNLVEKTGDIVFILGLNDIITYANPEFTKVFDLQTGDNAGILSLTAGASMFAKLKASAAFNPLPNSVQNLEFFCRGGVKNLSVKVTELSNGELYVVAQDHEELLSMRERLDYLKNRDISSRLYNQNALENFIQAHNEDGYRVVMAKIDDFKHLVQRGGFNYAVEIAERVAEAISEEFSMYNEFIFRSFEDEFVIFSRSPINNLHINQVNKRLYPNIKMLWGISRRGYKYRELLEEARYDLRDMDTFSTSGNVFGIGNEEDMRFGGNKNI